MRQTKTVSFPCLNPDSCRRFAAAFCRCSPQYNLDLMNLVNIIAEDEGAPSVADIYGRPLIPSEVSAVKRHLCC